MFFLYFDFKRTADLLTLILKITPMYAMKNIQTNKQTIGV